MARILIIFYLALVLAPLALVAIVRPPTEHGFIYEIGKNLGLAGFVMIVMQFILSGRLKWIENRFGLDILFRFHKVMAIVSVFFLLSHPLLLAFGSDWSLLFDVNISWHIWLGRVALILLLIHVALAACRASLRMQYQTWRSVHNVLAVLVLGFAFVHSWKAGGDLMLDGMRILWIWLLLFAVIIYVWHRWLRERWSEGQTYQVIEVLQEANRVSTLTFAPESGSQRFDFKPGQFHFLRFSPNHPLGAEEHHFTISSSPTKAGILSSTIKESGDFTGSIGQVKTGDQVRLQGAFGRFSYVFHPHEQDLVFIAGGIGITPLMSMLRHMRDTRAKLKVLLIYANASPADIVFRNELVDIEKGGYPRLQVVQIVAEPSEAWTGERGRLDSEKMGRLVGTQLQGKAFYICAPAGLMDSVIGYLKAHDVNDTAIHFERFSL